MGSSDSKTINLVHLYPDEMNIYGDNGNLLTLQKRLEWRGYKVAVKRVGIGDSVPSNTDILISGGGQDSGQFDVERDIGKKRAQLQSLSDAGVVMLVICGTYQLFGHRFITSDNKVLNGISIFDAHTVAEQKRLIGNVIVDSPFGEIVGFENHSGQTHLGAGQTYLGRVTKGNGNNLATKGEGAVTNNVFGSYLHGPMLPKNPHFADELIARALHNKFGSRKLKELEDDLERAAFEVACNRP